MIPDTEPYKLPNGCLLYLGGRVRVPKDDIWKIPEADREFIDLEHNGDRCSASEVVTRRSILDGAA